MLLKWRIKMPNEIRYSNGVGFCPLLTLLFTGLKLGKVIDWSWWWVLSPMSIPICFGIGIIVALIYVIIKK